MFQPNPRISSVNCWRMENINIILFAHILTASERKTYMKWNEMIAGDRFILLTHFLSLGPATFKRMRCKQNEWSPPGFVDFDAIVFPNHRRVLFLKSYLLLLLLMLSQCSVLGRERVPLARYISLGAVHAVRTNPKCMQSRILFGYGIIHTDFTDQLARSIYRG